MIKIDNVDTIGSGELNQTQAGEIRIEIGRLSIETDCVARGEVFDRATQFVGSRDELIGGIHEENDLATKIDKQPELKDRITIFGALTPLTFEDAVSLIDFRWKVAGGHNHPFEPEALEAIFKYSKGLPRKISKLCDNALIRALSNGLKSINRHVIEQVAQEVRLSEEFEAKPRLVKKAKPKKEAK